VEELGASLRSVHDSKIRNVSPDVFVTVALPLLSFTGMAAMLVAVRRAAVSRPGTMRADTRPTLSVELNGAGEPNPETVKVLLDGVQRMLDDEDRRGESLNTRGAAIAGLLGVVIALAGSLRVTRFAGSGYHAVAAVLTSGALVSFLAALGVIGWGVLLPAGAKAVAMEDVEQFPNWRFVGQAPMMVTGYLLRGAVGTLRRDRERNDRKAVSLRWGYIGMGLGLLLVSAAGILVTVEGIGHARPARPPAPTARQRALPAPGPAGADAELRARLDPIRVAKFRAGTGARVRLGSGVGV
jgi:hypothetical protein